MMVPLSGNRSTDAAARRARIEEIRRQIAAGTYETPDKIEAAVEAFLASDQRSSPDEQSPAGRRPAK